MNHREAAEVVAILRTSGLSVDDVTIRVWFESALRDLSFVDGRAVAMAMVAESSDYPTPARFNAKRRELVQAENRPELQRFEALPPMPTDNERVRQHIAEIREKLKNAKGPLAVGLRQAVRDGASAPAKVSGRAS